jgi:ribosomal RNA-processing protein 1
MSDKPLVQQALASELANVMLTVDTTASSLKFLEGFWQCILREWSGIDRLRCAVAVILCDPYLTSFRIDKYYTLIRRYVNASFRLLMREDWGVECIERYNIILAQQGGPLWCAHHSTHLLTWV